MAYVRTIWFVTFILQAFWLGAAAAGPKPADEAFRFEIARAEADWLEFSWSIAPGYYLYRDKIAATLGGKPLKITTARGEIKDDPTFGPTEIYHHETTAYVDAIADTGELRVTYQGCGEDTICYPPITKVIDLATLAVRDAENEKAPARTAAHLDGAAPAPAILISDHASDDRTDAPDPSGNPVSTAVAFFGFGLLLAFTPCVFPMLPILSGMLTRSAEKLSPARGFVLSGTYVLAMAGAYGALGIFAAWSGSNLQALVQMPLAVVVMSVIFVMLALSMFGLYDLQIPHSWSARLTPAAGRAGSISGAALLGFTSALIVGPCVTPPLAAALLYIARTGNAIRGSTALFALGLGMGAPLLALGTFGAAALPKSGAWLIRVKQAFGIIFTGMATWMVSRILSLSGLALAWGAFVAGIGLWFGWLAFGPTRSTRVGIRLTAATTASVLAIYGGSLAIGGITGWYAPLFPLVSAGIVPSAAMPGSSPDGFQTVSNESELDAAIQPSRTDGRPILIDFSAEWCTECRLMERTVFANDAVRHRLSGLRLIRADMTHYDPASKKLMARFAVIGPPTLIFLDAAGREVKGTRIVGATIVDDFLDKIAAAERG